MVDGTSQTMSLNPIMPTPSVSDLTLGSGADDITGQDSWLSWMPAGLL